MGNKKYKYIKELMEKYNVQSAINLYRTMTSKEYSKLIELQLNIVREYNKLIKL
ncbi:hypothetical protein I6U48_28905 [Clostridium sp. PL3]|uniref:Uncharacterized protein n=1 Tax=Clostridium thailandense TaxID=2794346 RepID=A0A949WYA7_9CLOT|nr:hypothetical protein [Clostridium thailandense]MBV7276892.1 hypothetical protein [Clostridium thailandense]